MTSTTNIRGRRPTRNDVARQANVSGWTVSNVLNGHSDVSISDQTRRRVLEAAHCLGYQANQSARALATGKTRTIGLWMCLGYSRYRAHALHRMQQLIKCSDFEIVVRDIEEETMRDGNPRNTFKIPVDGIVTFDTPLAGTAIKQQGTTPVPMVSMGAYWSQDGDYVGVDLRAGAVDAMRHLIDTGRRRIAHLLPVSAANESNEPRLTAYRDTLVEAGLEPIYLYAQDVSLATSLATVRDFIAGSGRIDAILCHDDGMAFGAHRALSDLNIKIGEEIALIGCDGIEETECLSPALSAIVQPTEEMCSTAWSYLENRIQNPGCEPQQIILKPRLAVRASTVQNPRTAK